MDSTIEKENEMKGRRHGRRCRRIWIAPAILAVLLAKGALVMLLWNALIPELFQGPALTYVQALGLMILAKLLVGFGGPFRRFGPPHHGGPFGRLRGRWAEMTPEEREKMRETLRQRCGR